MKRHHIAAMLILQSIGISAFAQSSVTIYGSVDNGITYVNNVGGKSVFKMQDGINKANALGFTGTEILAEAFILFSSSKTASLSIVEHWVKG